MALLARRLRAVGHTTSSYGYFVTRHSIDVIVDGFVDHIARNGGVDDDFAVIGHSLGNVITRRALPRLPGLRRFAMLAPPNHPPAMARALERSPVFRALTRDAGNKLLDADFYATLPVPPMPTLIVAGTGGPRFARLPFRGQDNDGVVGVDECRLDGDNVEFVAVDAIHTLIMNQRDVAGLLLRFLAEPQALPRSG